MGDDIVDVLRGHADMFLLGDPDLLTAAADEIERLRAALRGERFAHTRLWDWWSDALVERNRLRDGIAEHKRQVIAGDFSYVDGEVLVGADDRLWALIEQDDDCHFGHASTVTDGRSGTETTALIEEDDDE